MRSVKQTKSVLTALLMVSALSVTEAYAEDKPWLVCETAAPTWGADTVRRYSVYELSREPVELTISIGERKLEFAKPDDELRVAPFAISLIQKGNPLSTSKGYMFVDTVAEEDGQPTIVSGMAITNDAGSFEFYELTLFPKKRLMEIHNPPEQANCK